MASTTKIDGRTRGLNLSSFFGLACMGGGLLWCLLNAAAPLEIPLGPPVVGGAIGVVLLLGLAGGPIGLLALGAVGKGRAGKVGAAVTLVGLLSYLIGQLLQTVFGLATGEIGVFYAAGALLVGAGTLVMGTAAFLARTLAGWRRFAPISVGLYYVAMIPAQALFFIIPNGTPSATLLAFWGLTWMLLGYAIFAEAGDQRNFRCRQRARVFPYRHPGA